LDLSRPLKPLKVKVSPVFLFASRDIQFTLPSF
jgi:hypothetical protein